MVRDWIVAALAGLTIDAAACATNHASGAAMPREQMVVTVINSNYMDVDVYAVRGRSRSRVGSVTGLSTATFNVPAEIAPDGNLQLLIDPVGSSSTYTTETISVNPGQHVELTVAPVLRMSRFSVWSQ
jgi:hypothetical protein